MKRFLVALWILSTSLIHAAVTNNVAPLGIAASNRPLWGPGNWNIKMLNDEDTGNVFHLDQSSDPGAAYTIDLKEDQTIVEVVLFPRQDACCPERLTNFRVSVSKDDNGTKGQELWGTDLYTDGTNPGAGRGITVTVPVTPAVKGRWVEVRSLDDPVPAYGLQLTEVQVFAIIETVTLRLTREPADAAAGLGRTVTFSAGASAVGGDPARLGYQWQRNGADIAGATNASYTTPPVVGSDDKTRYRCLVSYPGIAALTTREATLRVNYAFRAKAATNRPLWTGANWSIGMIVDGDRLSPLHGDTAIEPGLEYTLDLGATITFEEIDIFPRQDGCCPDRLANFELSINKDDAGAIGTSVWKSSFFTADGENAGSGAGKVVRVLATNDPAGKFEGQWIRLKALADPVPDYFFQMTEIEAYGSVNAVAIDIFNHPKDVVTAPGHVARFQIDVRQVGGDPSLLSYQWLKDGSPIPGATASQYSTPPLGFDGTNAVYRCIVKYPGKPDLQSNPAGITFTSNYALGQPATASGPLWGPGNWNISQIVDGDRKAVLHGDTTPPEGFRYEVNLGVDVKVDTIDIFPRQDSCCPDRLANFRVSLHADDAGKPGAETWHVDLFTDPGSNAGVGDGTVVSVTAGDGTGSFHGHWLRIQALDRPVKDYFLQMTEVEVHGVATEIPNPAAPTLSYAVNAGKLVLTFSGGGLESAPAVTGPWSAVNGISPLSVAPDQIRGFYRVRR